jgi:competence protein ComEC
MDNVRKLLIASGLLLATLGAPRAQAPKPLDIYFIDVEGGQATLFVTPSGESMLIDTGHPENGDRDLNRVLAPIKQAGLTRLDFLLVTHYHDDHVGNAAAIAARIPVGMFVDHGETVETGASAKALYEAYLKGRERSRHMLAKPQDKVPIRDLDVTIVTAGGKGLTRSGPAAPNPLCASFTAKDTDPSENAQSVGSHVTFGKFRVVHPGDLTWNKEAELMCPNNRLGTADLLIVGHHGQAISNSEVLVHALRPRVSIINNGTRKGGQPDAMRILLNSPGLEDVWQSHFSLLSGQEYTVPGMFIGNLYDEQPEAMPVGAWTPPPQGQQAPPAPVHNGKAYWFKVSAQQDGTFTVTNQRNNFTKTYRSGVVATN